MSEPCKHDNRIIGMAEDVASIKSTLTALDKRINGSIDDIKSHISHGSKWRLCIVGVAGGLLISIVTMVHWSGRMCEKVDTHDRILKGKYATVASNSDHNTP